MTALIKSASHTRLVDFESCNFKAYLKHAMRVPDPNPSPAADRGTAIHQMGEDFIRGKIKSIPNELSKFADEFISVRNRDPKTVDLEQEWGFDKDWQPHPWKTAWFRIKADCVVRISSTEAIVIDYKTGKKFGNEVKHGEQCQLYALATFIMYPEIEKVTTELWYLDIDDLTSLTVPRKVALSRYLKMFDQRARRMTEATSFPPNPNIYSCRYCPYGETGHCDKQQVNATATADFWKRKKTK